jgi:predicted acylesterase/phospholipase RssA
VPDKLPVIVAARMSLSFPGLISAVPLYARDFTLKGPEKDIPRRCLFSDGGLSSNFPIHFFDHLWPNTPTFAIALGSYVKARNGETRVWLPETRNPGQGILLPIDGIDGLGGFLMRLVDAAKDWQDNLQSTLPGYRERIVHVALKPEEGGLNIAMPKKLVEQLAGYGADAGEILRKEFDLDEHRWRRFLIAMARMEQTLDELMHAYDGTPNVESFDAFLGRFPPVAKHYKQTAPILADMLKRARELVEIGREWKDPETIRSGNIPKPDTDLRITSKL